jgi:outer membrane protein W
MIKKLSLFAFAFLFSLVVFSQDSSNVSTSEKGKFTLEGQINPNFNGGNWFGSVGIRFRYFMKPNRALRISYNPYFYSETEKYPENTDGTGDVGTVKNTTSRQSFAFAYEYHLGKNQKFSPYVGGGVSITFINDKEKSTDVLFGQYEANYNSSYKQNTFGWGLFAMAGFDWYVMSNMYLGLELGLGFNANYEGKMKITATDQDDYEYPGGSNARFGTNYNGGVRIGWRF